MNCLIISAGGSFRDEPTHDYTNAIAIPQRNYIWFCGATTIQNSGSEQSVVEQKKATDSHLEFFEHLKQKMVVVDLIISTYDTPHNDLLRSWYKTYEPKILFNKELLSRDILINNALHHVELDKYDFIFIMRPDIVFKPFFFSIFDPNWSTVRFPFAHSPYQIENGEAWVGDVFLFIPKKYFYPLTDKIRLYHDSWYIFKEEYNLKNADMDVMINSYHDSNSKIDINPLYYILARREASHPIEVYNSVFVKSA